MATFDASILKLVGLANFLEQGKDFNESLQEMAAMAANLLNSQNCSIMLFREEEGEDPTMKIFASHGYLPQVAFTEKARHREGIAGHVAATGKPVLINDIENSPFAGKARWPEKNQKSFLSAPIFIGQQVFGVVNANTPLDGRIYKDQDLYLLTTVALVVGKSVQVVQLQNLLKSRFAQLALMQEVRPAVQEAIVDAVPQPARMAKVVGKSFYREMRKAGFGDDHIIGAATEVISLLSEPAAGAEPPKS